MAEIELNSADESIVQVLEEGRNTPSNIARRLDYSREYVSQRLKRLREHGLVERVDRGLYELTLDDHEDPAEEPEPEPEPDGPNDTGGEVLTSEVLDGWDYGRSDEEQRANMKIATHATDWLRDSGRDVRRSDVPLEDLAESDPLDRSPDTLWSEIIRDAWQHGVEQGYIEKPHSRAYRWTE